MEFYRAKAKRLIRSYGFIAVIAGLVLGTTHFLPAHADPAASFSYTPTTQAVTSGNTVTITISLRVTGTQTVDNALASFNYPTSLFTVANTDLACGGSALPTPLYKNIDNTNGTVKLGCYANPGNSETQLAAGTYTYGTITLHASGSGNLTTSNFNLRTDNAGDATLESAAFSNGHNILGDASAQVAITAPTANATVSGSSVTLTATKSGFTGATTSVQFKVDGTNVGSADTTSPYSITWDSSTVSNGTHTVSAVASDGTDTATASNVTITTNNDLTPPDTTIGTAPSNPSAATASVSFSSNEGGSTFMCKLDSGSYASCTSPKSLTGLTDGSHTFYVYATDPSGNVDSSPATTTWTADGTAPDTTITSGAPTGTVSATGATIAFSATETSTFQCKLDSGSYASCTSPKSLTGLTDGSHTFSVRATDSAGNVDASPASATWTVDTGAPNTTITSSPSNPSNNASPSIAFSSTEGGSTFECQLDSGSYASCTSPKVLSSLSEGSHTFNVKATDGAGNTDASPASVTWVVDTTAPDTNITSVPTGTVSVGTASVSFSSTEGSSTFQCQMDSGSYASCTSPKAYTGLVNGSHTFNVKATDAAGNVDSSAASATWTVDTNDHTAPTDPGDPSTNSPTTNPRPAWGWAASTDNVGVDHYTVQWCTDAGFSSSCSSDTANATTYTHTADLAVGTWYFRVQAVDASGNTSAGYGTGQVTVQLAPMDITDFHITPADTGATATWTTNYAADTTLEWGVGVVGGNFGNATTTIDTTTRVVSHTITLSSLLPCVTYHVRAVSVDGLSRSVTGDDTRVSTTGCAGGANVLAAASSNIVDTAGGSVTLGSGDDQIGLTVPANAAGVDLNYQVQQISDSAQGAATAPDGLKGVGSKTYQLNALEDPTTLHTSFNQPLTVTMHYSSDVAGHFKANTLAIYRRENTPWSKLDGCTVDTDARTVTCTTTHFSSFVLFGEEQSTAAQVANAVTSLPDTGAGKAAILLSTLGAIAGAVAYSRRSSRYLPR